MAALALPQRSKTTVVACIVLQAVTLYVVANHPHRSVWLAVVAFFAAGFLTDLISGLAHFGFDYVWPAQMPILGPIAVEFRQHHEDPTLDPSAVLTNLTKGAYGALPFAVITLAVAKISGDGVASFFVVTTLFETSLWMLGFHQIHAYTHMGSQIPPEEFNRLVAEISQLPTKRQQREEFAKLFETVGIPRFVRTLQSCRLFLRPEEHWRHHLAFESDFSSVNGWSDPVMNWLYRAIARRKKAKQPAVPLSVPPPSEAL